MNELDQGILEVGNGKQYLDIAEVVLITLDKSGLITLINKKGCEILEYEESELIGKNWFDMCIPDKKREDVREVFHAIMRGMAESLEFYENTILTKSKNIKLIAWHNTLLHDDNGEIIGTLSSGEDITAKKEIEQELIESEEKFRTIAEETEIGIAILQDKNVIYANRAIDLILGSSFDMREMWTCDDYFTLLNSKDSDSICSLVENLTVGKINSIEKIPFRISTEMGDDKWVELTIKHIKYRGKDAFMATVLDISDKKQTEQELRDISNLKSELIKRTSHELNTPLISIKGFTDLLLNLHVDKFDTEILSILKEINEGANRLVVIVNNLLKTSQLQSNEIQISKTKQNLSFLIKLCVNELQGLAKARNLKFIVDIAEIINVEIAKEDVYTVISHLIINAIKYTPPNGMIKIKSHKDGDYCIISIEDNGIGITIDESKQLFRKFGKIERYGKEWDVGIDGLGMGLYNSKKIIKLHGGKMWAESQGRNKGAKFFFTLPILKP